METARHKSPYAHAVQVGIAPQLELDAAALSAIPSSGDAFCKYILSDTAPPLLGGR